LAYVTGEQSYLIAVEAPMPRNWRNHRRRPGRQARRAVFSNKQKESSLADIVRDSNVDQALRVLKKRMQREGIFREMKRRRFYEKPSEKRRETKAKQSVGHVSSRASRRSVRA
jgi:ribosomal protein S21